MVHSSAVNWSIDGTSPPRLDVASLIVALLLHAPLYWVKFDNHSRAISLPTSRLVSIDLLVPEESTKSSSPSAPPQRIKETQLIERIKTLVRRELPPPPPMVKEMVPEKIELQTPKISVAPLSDKKHDETAIRLNPKVDKGKFEIPPNERINPIERNPMLNGSQSAAVIAIPVGKKSRAENYSAPLLEIKDKGRLEVPLTNPPPLDPKAERQNTLIAMAIPPAQINVDGQQSARRDGTIASTGVEPVQNSRRVFPGVPAVNPTTTNRSKPQEVASSASEIQKRIEQKKSMFAISGPLKDRKIERQVTPDYPDWAQSQGIEASVTLEFTVEPTGVVRNTITVRRTSGYARLDETAVNALRQWKFAPLAENREEVGLITFNYSLR